jgi:hypothetical protein
MMYRFTTSSYIDLGTPLQDADTLHVAMPAQPYTAASRELSAPFERFFQPPLPKLNNKTC